MKCYENSGEEKKIDEKQRKLSHRRFSAQCAPIYFPFYNSKFAIYPLCFSLREK